ncbi:MAG: DM13 domain-containing protein [Gemmatimonadales bacterium]
MTLTIRRLVAGAILVAGCSATPPTAPDAAPVDPAMPPPSGMAVQGRFAGAGGHRGAGAASLTVADGRALLEFGDDFTVSGVPGPFVYLNTTNNANTGTPLRVAALQRNSGAQQYSFQVPAGVRYTWILVWCDPFNTPVAEASIPATP